MKPFKLLLFVLIATPCTLAAQYKNALRVGVGVNVHEDSHHKLKLGPSLFAEYERNIVPYFSVGLNLHTDKNEVDGSHASRIGTSLRGIFTPFPRKFRWVRIGVGVTYERHTDSYGIWRETTDPDDPSLAYGNAILYSAHNSYWGFDFPIRAYFVDSERFECYAFYEMKHLFMKGHYYWNYSNGGIAFGVKF